jgi:hypothetical protein
MKTELPHWTHVCWCKITAASHSTPQQVFCCGFSTQFQTLKPSQQLQHVFPAKYLIFRIRCEFRTILKNFTAFIKKKSAVAAAAKLSV